uniref:Uncharacterized protein n=1 Tax=Acrobeloides nanus TaxID=290746 RepID=A0A914E707_9BILA
MSSEGIILEKRGKTYWIIFNRPKRRNAINGQLYDILAEGLRQANDDPDVMMTIFTGTGDFYSSGNDFSPEQMALIAENPDNGLKWKHFVHQLIAHKKPLIALVNGPAIGIACTTLAIFDLVIASDKAYFLCPFTEFGICPEGTSSLTFAQLMGHTKAAQMILFAEKLNAHDAFTAGFVAKVIPDHKFREETEKLIQKYTNLSASSMILSKSMMRRNQQKLLAETNEYEAETVKERVNSDETMELLLNRFAKSKM